MCTKIVNLLSKAWHGVEETGKSWHVESVCKNGTETTHWWAEAKEELSLQRPFGEAR